MGYLVANPPYLLFYPDKDRDDASDSEPEVRLSDSDWRTPTRS